MRFYVAEVDAPSPPLSSEVNVPMEVSLAHDFTRKVDNRLNVPEYQIMVNMVSVE